MINFIQLKDLLLKYPAFLHKTTFFCVALVSRLRFLCLTRVALVSHLRRPCLT